jgi:hypothetical protein
MTEETNVTGPEAERAEDTAEDRGSESEELRGRIAEMEESIASKDSELAALRNSLTGAVLKYRSAVLNAAPGVPADLINGDTVEEIDASLDRAREMVNRVRQELDAEAAAGSVPTGSPPRQALDLSGLSPAAKIQHALNAERS